MQNLPIGIHTFERIRNENYLYVDKTNYLYQLITTGSVYFISRPRRFGKSLLVSTLAAIFEGKKALFSDLWIGQNTAYEFIQFPVFKIDWSNKKIDDKSDLEEYVIYVTDQVAQKYGVTLTQNSSVSKSRLRSAPTGGALMPSLKQMTRFTFLSSNYSALKRKPCSRLSSKNTMSSI